MPIQRSGQISMSQLRAEFKNTNSGSVSFSELIRGGSHITDDKFVDPLDTIKTTNTPGSNMAISNYYNTTKGRWYNAYGTDDGNTFTEWIKIPNNCNRVHIRAIGGGGGGAVKSNETRRSMGGGGGTRFEATIVNSFDERLSSENWVGSAPWQWLKPGVWIRGQGGAGMQGKYGSGHQESLPEPYSYVADGGSIEGGWVQFYEPVPGFEDVPPVAASYDGTNKRRGFLFAYNGRGGVTNEGTDVIQYSGALIYVEERKPIVVGGTTYLWRVVSDYTQEMQSNAPNSGTTWNDSTTTTRYYVVNGNNPPSRYNGQDDQPCFNQAAEYGVCVTRGGYPGWGDLGFGQNWTDYWGGNPGTAVGKNTTRSPQVKHKDFIIDPALGEPNIYATWGYGGHTRNATNSPSASRKYGKAFSGTPGACRIRI